MESAKKKYDINIYVTVLTYYLLSVLELLMLLKKNRENLLLYFTSNQFSYLVFNLMLIKML